ncbi:MAG: hypothetical protein CJBNEKGG_00994 [Prosthecobacter sp.]|nr:hypothetical protein [Prosthecobacter sp.]
MPFPELLSLSPCTRQRLAGWFCVLSYVWVAMAPLAHAGRVLPLEGGCRSSCHDANGNRSEQTVTDLTTSSAAVTSYAWDAQDRLSAVVMPDGGVHGYEYDYRTRRIGITRVGGGQADQGTTVVFSGGLSLAEWESTASTEPPSPITDPTSPIVEYHRGPDMGGGVGGLLYSLRGSTLKYNLSNGRGDVVAQSNAAGEVTWTASYEAYGKRTKETGANADKQRANSKDEDPTGLLNEGFRYRDLETGVWLSRDPAGFVDGPNLYAYVQQNPWTSFDPHGLTGSIAYGQWVNTLPPESQQAVADHNGKLLAASVAVVAGAMVAAKVGVVVLAKETADEAFDAGFEATTGIPAPPTSITDLGQKLLKEGGQKLAREGMEKSAKEVMEKAATSTMTKKEIENARRRGIDRARREERSLVESGHPGTADGDGWSLTERKLISETGQFPKDTRWHHINDVKRNPEMADNADNVLPSRGGTSGHVEKYHPNGTQNGSSGPMLDRKATEAAQREVQE